MSRDIQTRASMTPRILVSIMDSTTPRNVPRPTAFFADLDPPPNLAPRSDEILVIERQVV
jgi:hypothetical protein